MCKYCDNDGESVEITFSDDGIGYGGNPIQIPAFSMNMIVSKSGVEFALRPVGNTFNEWISDVDIKYCPFCGRDLSEEN